MAGAGCMDDCRYVRLDVCTSVCMYLVMYYNTVLHVFVGRHGPKELFCEPSAYGWVFAGELTMGLESPGPLSRRWTLGARNSGQHLGRQLQATRDL